MAVEIDYADMEVKVLARALSKKINYATAYGASHLTLNKMVVGHAHATMHEWYCKNGATIVFPHGPQGDTTTLYELPAIPLQEWD